MINTDNDNSITEVTRRNVFDGLRIERIRWAGRLDELEFLDRVFDLSEMASSDRRFRNIKDDIWQHRVRNDDWPDDWVYSDPRFDLLRCDDCVFLDFLCEMIHPVVRPAATDVNRLLALYNKHISADGWEIVQQDEVSGNPVFAAQLLIDGNSAALHHAKEIADELGAAYLSKQINRMQRDVRSDPEQAIGTAKEFLETICKTILNDSGVDHTNKSVPWMVKEVLDRTRLGLDDSPQAQQAIQRLLGSLRGIGQSVAEVRNKLGTGHGKPADTDELDPVFSGLVVGVSTSLGLFLVKAYSRTRE